MAEIANKSKPDSSNELLCLGNTSTRRELPKSPPYLRLKNFQGTTIFKNIGNIWKKLFFFQKSIWLKKVAQCRKNPKSGHLGSLNVFYYPKTTQKIQGVPFDKIPNILKKVA